MSDMTQHSAVRGLRGATTVSENTESAILAATRELLEALQTHNTFSADDICSIFFSVTHDINATFPAIAARELGLGHVPLLCLNEIDVPGSLDNCIRILLHINTSQAQKEMRHIYLNEAVSLRPEFGLPA